MSWDSIAAQYGPAGIQSPPDPALTTDDTQMTLFTAEGILLAEEEADPVPAIRRAYLRWLRTQQERFPGQDAVSGEEGTLLRVQTLWSPRAPGLTCLSALRAGGNGTPESPANHSKGCGGIMRAAPAGLCFEPGKAFEVGVRAAALTHGHPSGYLPAGCLAYLVAGLRTGRPLRDVLPGCLEELNRHPAAKETEDAIRAALSLAEDSSATPGPKTVERLGGAWVGEEALAIALYAALIYENDPVAALRLAVNHSGDSDSTGAITGNLLGAQQGPRVFPADWLARLEARQVMEELADRF